MEAGTLDAGGLVVVVKEGSPNTGYDEGHPVLKIKLFRIHCNLCQWRHKVAAKIPLDQTPKVEPVIIKGFSFSR